MSTQSAAVCTALILGFPLLGAFLNGVFGPKLGRRFVNIVGSLSIFAALIASTVVLITVINAPEAHKAVTTHLWQWLTLGSNQLGVGIDFTIDPLSVVMLMVITGVGFLIHVYSIGYMEHEPDVARFFSYMNLFVFSMLVLSQQTLSYLLWDGP